MGESVHEAEIATFRGLEDLDVALQNAHNRRDFPAAFAAIAAFAPLLAEFFTHVLVMDEDKVLRNNRLRLMRTISERCSGIAHFNMLT